MLANDFITVGRRVKTFLDSWYSIFGGELRLQYNTPSYPPASFLMALNDKLVQNRYLGELKLPYSVGSVPLITPTGAVDDESNSWLDVFKTFGEGITGSAEESVVHQRPGLFRFASVAYLCEQTSASWEPEETTVVGTCIGHGWKHQ